MARRKWASRACATPAAAPARGRHPGRRHPGDRRRADHLQPALLASPDRLDEHRQHRARWPGEAPHLSVRTARLKGPTTFVQLVATEDGAELARLFREVGATPEDPPFVFVTLTSSGRVRDYAIALAIE